ncbi:MAG: sulfatase-like hydrolase/transferase [Mariniblastus sp.]|nr:sulfatase-like hydrolase/transferase [Mariniblastus sp.]
MIHFFASQTFLAAVVFLTMTSLAQDRSLAHETPNVLLIISEDNGPELGCYGDQYAKTPNLDRLASQGIRFKTAYVTQSVCSPSRGTILTGLYPHQNGQIGLATHQFAMFKEWPTTYSILKQAGYRTGMIGKLHVNPPEAIEKWIDFRKIKSSNFSKQKLSDYIKHSADFINQSDKPFFLTVNFPDAHWPVQNVVEGRPANPLHLDDVRPMDYMAFDNPRLRQHVRGFYNCMSRLDECVGDLLDALDASGKSENTLVIYLGDHGAQFARGKIFVTEGGLRIPLIMRWPGKTKRGYTSSQLASTIDLLPTIVSAAGAKIPEGLQGFDLGRVINGNEEPIRNYLFAERNTDAAIFHYPQRAIRDTRYKLTTTMLTDRNDPAVARYLVNGASNFRGSPTREELSGADQATQQIYQTWLKPPEIQLFDLDNDPNERVNLADDIQFKSIKNRLLSRLQKWQIDTDDKLRKPELLAALTQEVDQCLQKNQRVPKGGWQYLTYLAPDQSQPPSSKGKKTEFLIDPEISVEVSRIWNSNPHSAFTDLIHWNKKFYCAFRIGTGHVPGEKGEDGRIQIISSTNGKTWSKVATIVESKIDLRDPKLSVTPDGRLMLLMGGSNYDGNQLIDRSTRVAFMNPADQEFTSIEKINFDHAVASDDDWLWRVTWHKGVGYGVIYQANKSPWGLHLVSTRDGINYDLIKSLSLKGKPNESTIRFDSSDQMHIVVRNEDARKMGHWGRGNPPYDELNWNPIKKQLGGPNIVQLPDGSWILGTREYGNSLTTVLGHLSTTGKFKKLLTLPSGGDTSYPGMVVHHGKLWVSYYSGHQGRTAIYLATIQLDDLLKQTKLNVGQKTPTSKPFGKIVFQQRKIPPGVPLKGKAKLAKVYGYRIPSLLVSKQGSILAFSERRLGLHDHAQNDIVLKRSKDNGKSWSNEVVAFEDGMHSINDPLTVQLESGRILLMFARFPYGRHARDAGWIKMADPGYDSPNVNVLTYICHSDDDGLTWSEPVDISRQVKPPELINANTPGHMIQLTRGPLAGRVITGLWGTVPVNKNGIRTREWRIVVAYSDDQGVTWKRTRILNDASGKGFANECQIAEAANGDLILICRNQGGDLFRKKAISKDGGETWSNIKIDRTLPSVACMGSLIAGPIQPNGGWDLFASFPSNKGRKDGQIAKSIDNGQTWRIVNTIPGPFAYSALQVSPGQKELLLLYESGNYKSERLYQVPIDNLK